MYWSRCSASKQLRLSRSSPYSAPLHSSVTIPSGEIVLLERLKSVDDESAPSCGKTAVFDTLWSCNPVAAEPASAGADWMPFDGTSCADCSPMAAAEKAKNSPFVNHGDMW